MSPSSNKDPIGKIEVGQVSGKGGVITKRLAVLDIKRASWLCAIGEDLQRLRIRPRRLIRIDGVSTGS